MYCVGQKKKSTLEEQHDELIQDQKTTLAIVGPFYGHFLLFWNLLWRLPEQSPFGSGFNNMDICRRQLNKVVPEREENKIGPLQVLLKGVLVWKMWVFHDEGSFLCWWSITSRGIWHTDKNKEMQKDALRSHDEIVFCGDIVLCISMWLW